MQHIGTLSHALSRPKRSAPMPNGHHRGYSDRWMANGALLRALDDTLQRLQPQASACENLKGTARSAAAISAKAILFWCPQPFDLC